MVKIEKKDNMYFVSFKGNKAEFSDYLQKIMSIPNRDYDFKKKAWKISSKFHDRLRLFFGDDVFERDKKIPIISEYKDMGKALKLPPYDYQKEAIKFVLDRQNAIVVYPCGSGKTPIGIGIYLELRENNLISGPGLIVTKATLKLQWKKEIEKFSDLRASIIYSPADCERPIKEKIKRRENKLKTDPNNVALKKEIKLLKTEKKSAFEEQFDDVDLFVTNYETLRDHPVIRKRLLEKGLECIIADEVHYIKNHEAARSKALYEFSGVPYRVGMTATPIQKNLIDVFGLYQLIDPMLFPSWGAFAREFVRYNGYGQVAGIQNGKKNRLRNMIQPYIIYKSKEEVSEQLPELVIIPLYCELTELQQDMHQNIMRRLEKLKDQEAALKAPLKDKSIKTPEIADLEGRILALQTFAQELANTEELLAVSESNQAKDFITGSKSNKMELLLEIVEDIITSGEKVAIYSRFKRMQPIIDRELNKKSWFKKKKIAYLHSGLSDKKRYVEVYDKFRDKEEYAVLLSSDAGAEGINLSKCKYIVEVEPAQSPLIQTQRQGRVERADSIHDTVFVYQLIANNSWDTIQEMINNKKDGYIEDLIRPTTGGD